MVISSFGKTLEGRWAGIAGDEQASDPHEQRKKDQSLIQLRKSPGADGVGAIVSCHPNPEKVFPPSYYDPAG